MKLVTSVLAALVLAGAVNAYAAADGVVSDDQLAVGNYCHMKFPAIDEDTLAGNQPALKSANDGNLVDFYGPCDENPLGKDQVQEQKIEDQRMWGLEYAD
jgi:hypothetical protein